MQKTPILSQPELFNVVLAMKVKNRIAIDRRAHEQTNPNCCVIGHAAHMHGYPEGTEFGDNCFELGRDALGLTTDEASVIWSTRSRWRARRMLRSLIDQYFLWLDAQAVAEEEDEARTEVLVSA